MRPAALLLLFAAFAACAAEPSVELACSAGTARVALRGGRVLSYVPADGEEVFFSAAHQPDDPSDWFYGGLPFCWPWFGRRGPEGADVHGCVRTMMFAVRSRRRTRTSDTVVLGCTGDGTTPFFLVRLTSN